MSYAELIQQCKDMHEKSEYLETLEPLQQAMLTPEADSEAFELLLSAYRAVGYDADAIRYVAALAKRKQDRTRFVTPKALKLFRWSLYSTCRADSNYPQAYQARFKKAYSEEPEYHCSEAHIFINTESYDEALESVQQHLKLGGECIYCHDIFAWLIHQLGQDGPPRLSLGTDLSGHSDEEIWRALELARYDKDDSSQRLYVDELLRRFPRICNLLLELLRLDWEDTEKSKQLINELTRLYPGNPTIRTWEISLYIKLEQPQKAQEIWEELLREQPWVSIIYRPPQFTPSEKAQKDRLPRGAMARSIDAYYQDLRKAMDWLLP